MTDSMFIVNSFDFASMYIALESINCPDWLNSWRR